MGDDQVNLQPIHDLKDSLSKEEQDGSMGKILSYITDLAQGGWSIRKAWRNVDELTRLSTLVKRIETILRGINEDGKEVILEALKFQKINSTSAMNDHFYNHCGATLEELWESVAQGKLDRHDKTKKLILDAIQNYHREECNNVIKDMAKADAYVAAFQLAKIYIGWKRISAASNLIQDPQKFTKINRQLTDMKEMVAELVHLCKTNPSDQRINRKMGKINNHYTSTLGEICDLKIKINGHIQQLDLLGDYSAVDGVVNFVTAGSQGCQLVQAWDSLTSFSRGLGLLSVASFLGLALGNWKMCFLTQEKLKDLRKDLREATRLQEILQELHDKAVQVYDQLED